MPNERYDAVVEECNELLTEWAPRVGLGSWEIDLVFLDEYESPARDDYATTATTQGRWQYEQAKIAFYLPVAAGKARWQLERVMVHELCHVLLMPEQDVVFSYLELLGETLDETAYAHVEEQVLKTLELSTERATRAVLGVRES